MLQGTSKNSDFSVVMGGGAQSAAMRTVGPTSIASVLGLRVGRQRCEHRKSAFLDMPLIYHCHANSDS